MRSQASLTRAVGWRVWSPARRSMCERAMRWSSLQISGDRKITTEPGLGIRLGIAAVAAGRGSPQIEQQDLETFGGPGGTAALNAVDEYSHDYGSGGHGSLVRTCVNGTCEFAGLGLHGYEQRHSCAKKRVNVLLIARGA